jgi:hypothetical protein
MTPTKGSHERLKEQDITRVRLTLEPVKSVFLVGQPASAGAAP